MTDKQREVQAHLRSSGPQDTRTLSVRFDCTVDAMGKALNRLAERGIVARRSDGTWTA
jgi:predicted transcriptional regulator